MRGKILPKIRKLRKNRDVHNYLSSFSCQQTISGGLIEESLTPPPAYAITIESGESLFQPPSYKMIFPSTYSFSQDSYGGLPDFSCFSAVSSDHQSLASPLQSPRSPRNSLTSTSPLILTGGSVTPASSTCPNTPSRPLWETRRTSTSEYNLLRVQNLSGLDENNVYEFDSQTGGWREISQVRRGSQ